MNSPLSVATVIEKNKLSSDVAFLICLDIQVIDPASRNVVETLYVVNNTEDIQWNGNDYSATKFDIQLKSESGVQSDITLNFTDYTRALQQRMELYGGGIGFQVTMSIVNSGNLNQPPEVVETFQVTSAVSQEYVVNFTLGAENALTFIFPKRRQTKDYCQWKYKDANTCKYAGPLGTCDYTLLGSNGCAAHSNTVHFGAFPAIVSSGNRYG